MVAINSASVADSITRVHQVCVNTSLDLVPDGLTTWSASCELRDEYFPKSKTVFTINLMSSYVHIILIYEFLNRLKFLCYHSKIRIT